MPEYISKYFTREEVQCKCGCEWDTVDPLVLDAADAYREHLGQPITPSSVCRCVDHNRRVGGTAGSYHMPRKRGKLANGVTILESKAMDLPLANPRAAGEWFKANRPSISFIVYKTFIHIDSRKSMGARLYQKWAK